MRKAFRQLPFLSIEEGKIDSAFMDIEAQNQDGQLMIEYNAIAQDEALGKGTYRMICYLATDKGLAQSYVYLTVQ